MPAAPAAPAVPAAATRRPGGAILLVLAAAAVIAFATAGALAAASEMHRQELAERSVLEAELAAEAALASRVAGWDAREAARAGVTGWLTALTTPPGHQVRTHLQPAGPGLWRLDAAADRLSPHGLLLASRSRSLFLRARPPTLPLNAPLTAAGALSLGAGVQLLAAGEAPPSWDCASALPAAAPLALLPGGTVAGAVPAPVVDADAGVPGELLAAIALPAATSDRHVVPTLRHATLTTPVLEGSGISPPGACALGLPHEAPPPFAWGDPARPSPCERYLPYVHVQGDLVMPTGAGQGILVVDGDLTLAGGFRWAGLIVVRGAARTSGSAIHIHGALVLLGAGPHELDGDVLVAWSPCALAAIARAAANVTPVTNGPWSALR